MTNVDKTLSINTLTPAYIKKKIPTQIQSLIEATSMSNKVTPSLVTVPVEIVYRILDNLDGWTIFLSFRDICTRLNAIVDTYYPYQVNFILILK